MKRSGEAFCINYRFHSLQKLFPQRKCIVHQCYPSYNWSYAKKVVRHKLKLRITLTNPTNTNALKLKTAQNQLAGIYIKEQTEYIQNQIDKIRDSVEDRQSRIA